MTDAPALSRSDLRTAIANFAAMGCTAQEAAGALGITRAAVAGMANRAGISFGGGQHGRRDRDTRPACVPAWAVRAGLAAEYRDHASLYGEHAAAAHCRAMKREMTGAPPPPPARTGATR